MSIDWDIETITDPAADIDHQAAVREIRDTKRPKEEMYRAALYTYRLCYVTRTVGRGADQLAQKDYAAQLGYSPGYITALKRLGRAIAFHRVPTNTPVYSAILNNAGRKEYGRLLESPDPIPYDQLARAVAEIDAPTPIESRAKAEHDCEHLLQQASEAINACLPQLAPETIQRLEERARDLHFQLRCARRGTASA